MLQRGLLPYFSHEALAELDKIQLPPTIESAKAYDLRELLWSSIDNDDSLDLDQQTVAEAMSGDRIKIRVAVADVDSLVKRDQPSTDKPTIILHPFILQARYFQCCRKGFPPISRH